MKKISKLICTLAFIFAFSLILTACSSDSGTTEDNESENTQEEKSEVSNEDSGEAQQGGDLIVGNVSAPTLFNDMFSSDVPSDTIEGFMFDPLTTIDENLEPAPGLAEDWEYSEEELKWTFHLREGVNWHDGEPFTAEDVAFSYNIPLNEEYTGPRGSHFASIESIEATDDYTVEITLKRPDAKFLFQTTVYDILPKHILGDIPVSDLDEADFNTKNPVGTGPFKFDEWVQGQYVKVVANDDYFQGRPYLDSITYKIVPDKNALLAQYQAGDIDYMRVSQSDMPTVESLIDQGQAQLEKVPDLQYNYIGYNLRNPIFEDKKVRQALTHALDREEILETIVYGDGELSNSPGLPFSWAYNEDVPVFEYDPEKAKELLSEAGWEDTDGDGIREKDGTKLSFSIKSGQGREVREQITQVAQQQWAEVGVEVTPEIIEWSAFIDQIHQFDYDAYVLGWSLTADPSITSYFHSDEVENGLNYGAYSNPELDKLMEESDMAMDQEKRAELIEEAQAIVAEEQPYTFLYSQNGNHLFVPQLHPNMHSGNSYYKIHEWWMEQ
ncbi:peptide-binding protein [Oceanobacillus halotolerans]|uniref:peptide-binding protein n=1 Tax=Oceanobacillus halotolerans TaxID=2663380 RepID=UPI0013D987FF|nr:peptide-binding protein [Oceanobacillus halotolerans]